MIHDSIKNSKLVWIDGAGHEINVDKADDCIKAILEFLDSLKRSS
jgi:pimeloyl-ACP methyl ester carboxylesterase